MHIASELEVMTHKPLIKSCVYIALSLPTFCVYMHVTESTVWFSLVQQNYKLCL